MNSQFSNQFRLSITEALSTQLHAALEALEPARLTQENLEALYVQAQRLELPSLSGVYQLFRQGADSKRELTYVGKADQPLPRRLGDHLSKLSGRRGISLTEMYFRCLFVEEDLSSVSPEKMLIKRHLQTGKIVWNNRGFGINDPGRERDTTKNSENHWDLEFPIDLSREIKGLGAGPRTLKSLLDAIKEGVPFNFRFQQHGSILYNKPVVVPRANMTAHEAFRLVAEHLPDTWQVSALVGWAIMYNDNHKRYPSAFRYYRSGGVIVDQRPETRTSRSAESGVGFEDGENALF